MRVLLSFACLVWSVLAFSDMSFSMEIVIKVVLVGLLDIQPDRLNRLLTQAMPTLNPACRETGDSLEVQYNITYQVTHLSKIAVVEQLLEKHMHPAGKDPEIGAPLFDIEVTDIEESLEAVFESDFVNQAAYSFLVLNPNKRLMKPEDQSEQYLVEDNYFYRYRYQGGGRTNSWIGRSRYVVFDLSAGPVEFGPTQSTEGAVSEGPNIETDSMKMLTQLSATIMSGVRQVFVPDVQLAELGYAEKLIVPVIVLRNHIRFDPLLPSSEEFFIDIEAIKQELEKMLLPHQELYLVTALHSLSDHPQMATALFSAIKSDTIYVMDSHGHVQSKSRSFIDPRILLEDMRFAGDSLAAATLRHPSSDKLSELKSVRGHRVVPVFIFSVLGFPRELLIDKQHLHYAGADSVVVLQTGSRPVEIPYFDLESILTINPRASSRHIVAGLASVLGGVSLPFDDFSQRDREVHADFSWANGYHPFGPFSNTSQLSLVFLDVMLRNPVLLRLNHALKQVRRAKTMLGDFIVDFRPPGQPKLRSDWWKSIGELRLVWEGFESLERDFRTIADQLRAAELQKAYELAQTLHAHSLAFEIYVRDEVSRARDLVRCLPPPSTSPNVWVYLLFSLVVCVVAGVGLYLMWQQQRSARHRTQFKFKQSKF